MTGGALGALLGLVAGSGALLAVAGRPWRRPRLDDRLAPYLRDAAPSRLLAAPAGGAGRVLRLERALAPILPRAAGWAARVSGGSAGARQRLERLGSDLTVEQFHAEQVIWGMAGALLGGGAALVRAVGSAPPLVPFAALVVIGALSGVLARDHLLTRQVARREERILAEFPAVAELLALAVGAGEGAAGALDRVAASCRGELADELRRTLADARSGASLVQALEGLATRTSLPSLARFVDGVAVAVERGTPLGEVLRAQASDVRDLARQRLLEAGGKKEIAMMVPVVFLVLPVTVAFAVYPGLAVLEIGL